MSDLNKIFPESSITVKTINMNTLCFIDGLLALPEKYALTIDTLEIYQSALEEIALFYNYNACNIYLYDVLLNTKGVIISGYDKNGSILSGVDANNTLVFVNGKLLQKSEYEILDSGEIALLITIPQIYLQNVLIYVSKKPLTYQQIIHPSLHTNTDTFWDSVQIPYNPESSILFINGKKIDLQYIEIQRDSELNIASFGLNYPVKDTDVVEYYDLRGDTKSCNFLSTLGYSTFGPVDAYGNKLPLIYNIEVTFDDLAKYVIDNIRQGIIISNNEDTMKLVVVDTEFETPTIKCYANSMVFSRYSYGSGQYYIESPDVRSIVNYLSEFDQKNKIFIPEILEVFQNTILKEIYDSIIRLKDIRNISRVDSYHIDRLLALLGVNLNIKTLTLKQRHELLEELNEFYRIVGTYNSYNLINVIQDNIKLVSMQQLFTPKWNKIKTNGEQFYSYEYHIVNSGSGYAPGNRIQFSFYDEDSKNTIVFPFTVETVDENGGLVEGGIIPELYDGLNYTALGESQIVQPTDLNLKAFLNTIYTEYNYNYVISNSENYNVGDKLSDPNNNYNIEVTSVKSEGGKTGVIDTFNITKGSTTGNNPLIEENLQLELLSASTIKLKINSTETSSEEVLVDTSANQQKLVFLEPGTYTVELEGAGGGGGSSFTTDGGSASSQKGFTGETTSKTFSISTPTLFKYTIGGGGVGGDTDLNRATPGQGGGGYVYGGDGSNGFANQHHWTTQRHVIGKWHFIQWKSDDHYAWASAAAGGGGGATGIESNDKSIVGIASGGRGGDAAATNKQGASGYSTGGLGGYGNTTTYGNDKGGSTSWRWKAGSGANGRIRITRKIYSYTGSLQGDLTGVNPGYSYDTNNKEFNVLITSISGGNVRFNLTPTTGYINYNDTLGNNVFDLNFVSTNHSAKLSISSTLVNTTYSITNMTGSYPLLHIGASLTATSTDEMKPAFTATGTVTAKNSKTGIVKVEWNYPQNIHYAYYANTPMDISVENGTGARISVETNDLQSREMIREYVDFYTIYDLLDPEKDEGLKTEYRFPVTEYGTITEGTNNSPDPLHPEQPDIDYGFAINTPNDTLDYDYGLITDKIKGEWVRWWDWQRDSDMYPTNHVDIEIKMESTTDTELKNKFVDQFYNLASTVLYIHSIAYSYFFGSGTQNVSSGITDPSKKTIFLGLQTGQPIDYQIYTLTSDPQRQINDNNLFKG